ncbi:hypothetical protein KC333_g120 [Hortaea werneckii]|nr:hypothetical protein KC333_g120 [Hortaea werneckii]
MKSCCGCRQPKNSFVAPTSRPMAFNLERSATNARKGATPVPAPTMTTGVAAWLVLKRQGREKVVPVMAARLACTTEEDEIDLFHQTSQVDLLCILGRSVGCQGRYGVSRYWRTNLQIMLEKGIERGWARDLYRRTVQRFNMARTCPSLFQSQNGNQSFNFHCGVDWPNGEVVSSLVLELWMLINIKFHMYAVSTIAYTFDWADEPFALVLVLGIPCLYPSCSWNIIGVAHWHEKLRTEGIQLRSDGLHHSIVMLVLAVAETKRKITKVLQRSTLCCVKNASFPSGTFVQDAGSISDRSTSSTFTLRYLERSFASLAAKRSAVSHKVCMRMGPAVPIDSLSSHRPHLPL